MLETLLHHIPLSFHVFMLFATVTVAGALGVAFFRNIVYAAFSLLLAFAGVVGLFGFLSADFLAVVQLMVYVGGILVLILFAVMLTNRIGDTARSNPLVNLPAGLTVLGLTVMTLVSGVLTFSWPTRDPGAYKPTASEIGRAFLGPNLINFELAGVVLLAALVAAVVVARKEIKPEPGAEGGER